jgi:hypothetical protein
LFDYSHLEGLAENVDEDVTKDDRRRLKSLLEEFSDVFSRSEYDLGCADLVEHPIFTGDSRPIKQMLRRHPIPHVEAIRKQTEEMIKQDVVEPACGEWRSNVVLVKKKDGSLRFCIDYRQLNDITRKDVYPLPRIDVCLDSLSGAQYFSTFDLRSGYHQVPMREEDRDKTAYVTREGTFRFKKMPFGLCNAGATFQRLMDLVMAGLNFEICLVYLDDIVLYSKDISEHLERLRVLLTRLRGAKLKLKPSKCHLLRREVEFLGHVVSGEGVGTDPKKIEAVEYWPTPAVVRDVRSFLGLASYYRKFVRSFAEIAAPLHALTGKNTPFHWTDGCQRSFEQLKLALIQAPVLAMPVENEPYLLDTDASNHGIGAVLSQLQDGQERPVAYASRTYSRPELNYCVTRKELLAVIYYIKHFRQYLLGRRFTVRTDHSALQWLRKTPQPIGQQARWLEIMEEFDFVVEHRPGTKHTNADALSRRPCIKRGCCVPRLLEQDENEGVVAGVVELFEGEDYYEQEPQFWSIAAVDEELDYSVDGLQWTWSDIAEAQKRDPELRSVYRLLEESAEKPDWAEIGIESWRAKCYWHQWPRLALRKEVLCRKWETTDGLRRS